MKVEHHDFLIEIGTEELPPRALHTLERALVANLAAALDRAALGHAEVAGSSPRRRLAVWVRRPAPRAPEQQVRRKGPPLAAAFDDQQQPTRAALAFAESCGTTVAALERLDEGKGTFLFFAGSRSGERAVDLLPGIVQSALEQLPVPRRMHWGAGAALFVRPVHWVLMLLGQDVVPAPLLEPPAGHVTQGHRFHAPKALRITSPGAYERTLRERGRVLADFAARRDKIRADVGSLAASLAGRALIGEALLEEVTALVEW